MIIAVILCKDSHTDNNKAIEHKSSHFFVTAKLMFGDVDFP